MTRPGNAFLGRFGDGEGGRSVTMHADAVEFGFDACAVAAEDGTIFEHVRQVLAHYADDVHHRAQDAARCQLPIRLIGSISKNFQSDA